MAGFLSSALGGVLGGVGVAGLDAAKTLQNYQTVRQQQTNRDAFNKALDAMGPEGEIFRQMRDVGQDVRQQYIRGQIDDILRGPGSDFDKASRIYALTGDDAFLKDMLEAQRFNREHPLAGDYKGLIRDWLANPPAGVDEATKSWATRVLASDNPAEPEQFWKAVVNKFYGGYWNERLTEVPTLSYDSAGRPTITMAPFGSSRATGGLTGAYSVGPGSGPAPTGPPTSGPPPGPGPTSSAAAPAASPDESPTATPSATPSGLPTASALPSYVSPTLTPTPTPTPTPMPRGVPPGTTLPGAPTAEETESPEEILGTPTPEGTIGPTPEGGAIPLGGGAGAAHYPGFTPSPTPTGTPEPVVAIPPDDATIAPTPSPTPTMLAGRPRGIGVGTKAGPGYAQMASADRMIEGTGVAVQAVRLAAAQLPGGLDHPVGGTNWDNFLQVKYGVAPDDPRVTHFMAMVSALNRSAALATTKVAGGSAMRTALRMVGIHIPQPHDSPQLVLQKLDTFDQPGGLYDLYKVEAGMMTSDQYMQRLTTGPLAPNDFQPVR
jgi:hypothetical protein